jgi:hypothetical protein
MIDLPDGRSWGKLQETDVRSIVHRSGDPRSLRDRYRGLATLGSFQERLVEAELLFQEGWGWLDRRITGAVIEGRPQIYADDTDEAEDRVVVRIFTTGSAASPAETWEAVVERGPDGVTLGECGDEPWDLPTFAVTSLARVDADDDSA